MQLKKREANYYHMKLLEAGFKEVKDECVMNSHLYYFDCGCCRVYSVDLFTLKAEEKLYPCKTHKSWI